MLTRCNPFILTVYCFYKRIFLQQHNVSLSQDGSRKLLYFTPMVYTVPGSQPNKTLLGGGKVGWSQPSHHCKTAKTTLSSEYRSISYSLLNQCFKKRKEKIWQFWGLNRTLHRITKVYLIKLSLSVFTVLVKHYTSVRDLWLKYPSLPWFLSIDTMTFWICIVVKINVALGGWYDTYSKQFPFFSLV